ncbi:hypothetical protein [Desemzia sp. FAM 23991]|uniref:hypothetical protein n=1 Tax=unclassified Desemzia TaxID=2685243 RepID=UPI003884E064
MSTIEEASQNIKKLENARYLYSASQDIGKNNSKINSEGIFVNIGNEIMWHTQTVLGQADNETRILTEDFQRSGVLYQRFGLVNEKNEYLEEFLTPEWEIIAECVNRSLLYLDEVYELTYTEDYRDSVMEMTIEKLEAALENQNSETGDDFYISSLKQSINKQQNTKYTNKKVLMKVNEENTFVYVLT